MEESWTKQIRNIVRRHQKSVVNATIDEDNHFIMQTVDGSNVDGGFIKEKDHGPVVYIAYDVVEEEPDIYVTRDGAFWEPVPSEIRFSDGAHYNVKACCWTGDRYLVGATKYADDMYSLLAQSLDGTVWSFHRDPIFNKPGSLENTGIVADGNGFVILVGDPYMGPLEDSNIVLSYDFGETWETYVPVGDYPFSGYYLTSIAIKDDKQWLISDGSTYLYTYDAGAHWNEAVLPIGPMTENMGITYFNGYWWIYGQYFYDLSWDDPSFWGIDILPEEEYEWNTVLIKSKDLLNWESVTTPWNGNYPPLDDYEARPVPIGHRPGMIWNLEVDPLTNTMIANGENPYNQSMVMMSTDGGYNWFEIGYRTDESFKTDYSWDGIYNWPDDLFFANSGGMTYAYGFWFVVNNYGSPEELYPPILRISPDGKRTEAVYPPNQVLMQGRIILSGDDIT